MPSMDYCKFENTLTDLRNCKEDLDDSWGIENVEEKNEDNPYERRSIRALVQLCVDIAEEYGDELERLNS